ncbi:hypothetical protein VE03_07107 [Pseudogymnoascus sp. 23342-1-I1]|nr:hypothetical protein VE03_07107 [Pseudogymnoascus sp. 23342-1-I1]
MPTNLVTTELAVVSVKARLRVSVATAILIAEIRVLATALLLPSVVDILLRRVCCSAYGFCGTTTDFCTQTDDEDSSCQSNCGFPVEPSCSSNDVSKKVIGYYESWSTTRKCDSWRPGDIAANSLTHLNFAFALFKEYKGDWEIYFDQSGSEDIYDLISEFIDLKQTNPGLSCFLSIGGWAFNDGDTASYWSDMASTEAGRKSWSNSVLQTVMQYGFDGVDLDWEYPVADDRGGSDEDKENYVKLIKELRSVFDTSGVSYGITFTIPTSYWYLRNFDIAAMVDDSGANWVNVMSYDLHGTWDGDSPWTESVLAAHTNLTEIQLALDLLWRNDIDPSKVILGIGFYGRGFTMEDSTCNTPGCAWSSGGNPGTCTDTEGILSYKEISELMADADSILVWDEAAAVNYLTYDDDQWVSFDTNVTFKQKIDFANSHCLGGLMIWAVDQDTYDWEALSALLGEEVDGAAVLQSGEDKGELASAYSAYTGADCYVTGCFDYNKGQCKTGYSVLDYVHSGEYGVIQKPDDDLCKVGDEGDGQYRLICCPTDAMPQGCLWGGDDTLYGDGLCAGGTSDFCGNGKFELIQDGWTKRTGGTKCVAGAHSFCCNTNPELDLCSWTSCMGSCPTDLPYTYTYESEWEGPNLSPISEKCEDLRIYTLGSTAKFCCPAADTYKNCEWLDGDYCTDTCPSDKVMITQRPAILNPDDDSDTKSCSDGFVKLCCDPPDATNNFPVNPDYIFEYPDEDNTSWYYNVEQDANDEADSNDSEDPFALVMITGDEDAYDESLVDQWTFLDDDQQVLSKRDSAGKKIKRDIFTKREDTFDNVVETHRITCNSLGKYANETRCQSIFKGGAKNTIVKMPDHAGAGPYARVISLEPVTSSKRATTQQEYELVTDYDLAAAAEEAKGNVNFRIDYTNLLEYWDEITDEPATRKRWFGDFDGWLKKMTTITSKEDGTLPLEYEDTIKLFHFQRYCPTLGLTTTLDLDANIHLGLYTQYGYYFEGSILPTPELISAYGYFSIAPVAAILMTLRGEAVVQTHSDTVDIISGIGFPGLSIKGLASIGPEFALTGSMDTSLSVSGEINAGLSVVWDKTTVFFPQTAAGDQDSSDPGSVGKNALTDDKHTYAVEASLDAGLSAEGNLALHLTPEVKFGISILGGKLMEGYVTAGVTNTVTMGISASTTTADVCYWADYTYSVFLNADLSFVDDLAYWGGDYEVASSDDPIPLVDKTCISYSDSKRKAKRSTESFAANTTASSGCFGGLIACSTTEEEPACDAGTDDTDESTTTKRACTQIPALWYNCDYMGSSITFNNLNENTKATTPTVTFISICENIRNYLERGITTTPSGVTVVAGSNWMQLTYLPGGTSSVGTTNRNGACSVVAENCASTKSAMWPTAVQSAASLEIQKKMVGYSKFISCDEFPFNASEEGGNGAEAECVPHEYQLYQAQINRLIPRIYDTISGKAWSHSSWAIGTTNPRKYTVTVINGASLYSNGALSDGTYLGIQAGSIATSSTYQITDIIGGLNLFDNPKYSVGKTSGGNNALCRVSLTKSRITGTDKVVKKRELDIGGNDNRNWKVKSARLLPGWEKEAYFDDGTPVWRGEADRSSSADEALVTPSPDLEDMDLSKFSDMDRDLYSPHTTR